MITYSLFGVLLLINLMAFYVVHISKKHHALKLVTASFWNLVKNMQKSDPIGLRAEIKKLDKEPREIIESMLYEQN